MPFALRNKPGPFPKYAEISSVNEIAGQNGSDWVVKEKPQLRFVDRLSSLIRERILYPTFFHPTFWEKDRDQPIAAAREFILRQLESPMPTVDLLDADQRGFTRFEYDSLRRCESLFSWERWRYLSQWLGMQTVGRLSKGVRVGWKSGFDSGELLDHVYRNNPEGVSPFGRWIDRVYLNSPGWRDTSAEDPHSNDARTCDIPKWRRDIFDSHRRYCSRAGTVSAGIHPASFRTCDFSDAT